MTTTEGRRFVSTTMSPAEYEHLQELRFKRQAPTVSELIRQLVSEAYKKEIKGKE